LRRLPAFEEKIRHQIRHELAIKPVITMTALKERIEDVFGCGFDYECIRRLVGNARNEIVVELTARRSSRAVYWKDGDTLPKPLACDKVEVAKNVVMLNLAILTPKPPPACTKSPSMRCARAVCGNVARWRTVGGLDEDRRCRVQEAG
jgi:hypothetical protein